jgi:hypothetical protein
MERLFLKTVFYLPIKVNTAAPTANRPVITPGTGRPSSDKPKRRKNNIVHQAAIELGVLISLSSDNYFEAARACYV